MFTGIIEELGVIQEIKKGSKSSKLLIKANKVLESTKVGDSICTNGVCLTVTDLKINKEIIFEAGEDGIIGLFVFVGLTPQTDLFKGLLNLDEKGYIKTNEKMETNIKGVYAVGDCRVKDLRQVITASNDGAIAAINVEKYIG